jgi:hypothetical protein
LLRKNKKNTSKDNYDKEKQYFKSERKGRKSDMLANNKINEDDITEMLRTDSSLKFISTG